MNMCVKLSRAALRRMKTPEISDKTKPTIGLLSVDIQPPSRLKVG
ncbi:MAG: hypothetical protein QXK12_00655 [Candidatus Nezhaarchaeales archaeon]